MSLPKTNYVGWADLAMEDYHRVKAEGSTMIKKMIDGPIEYFYYVNTKQKDSSCFDLGSALHSVILEQNTGSFLLGPDVNKNTNEWKMAKKDAFAQGKSLLDPEQYAAVLKGFEVFCQHPMAHKLVSFCQKIEKSGFYMDKASGLWCKFRPDGYCANDTNGDFIFDYKSARSISNRSIENAIVEYGYHISAAHYIEGIKALTGRDVKDYYLCFQKSSGSMDRVVKVLDPDAIAHGKALRDEALLRIADCRDKGHWPGISEKIEGIGIPQWGYDKDGDFLTREAI